MVMTSSWESMPPDVAGEVMELAVQVGEGSIRSVPKGMQGMAGCARPMRASSECERLFKSEQSSVRFCSNDKPLHFEIPKSKADRRA
jgi:hypothetical protein